MLQGKFCTEKLEVRLTLNLILPFFLPLSSLTHPSQAHVETDSEQKFRWYATQRRRQRTYGNG